MQNKKIIHLTQAASIAALYVVLTLLSNILGLANYAIQIRFSEALTILPLFTPAAIPGLYVGCLLSNILTGCIVWDIIFGPLATLLGALGTRYLCQKCKRAAPLPPILSNTIIIPFILSIRCNVIELKYLAKAIINAIFINSEGCNFINPKFIHL